jgi:hypothetical protein
MKSNYMPMTVRYDQPLSCAGCQTITTIGIREYDAEKVPTERALCAECMLLLVGEYIKHISQLVASYQAVE